MYIKKICESLNFVKQCRKYNLGLWQCPSFLFLLTGLIIIIAMISTYLVAMKYTQPEIVALIVITITTILFIINHFIIQSVEKLTEANRMKSEFISIVSHQLRTPLTGIKWTLNLITRKEEKVKNCHTQELKEISENNERMIKLVNDLLDVSKVEQKNISLALEKTDIKELLQKIIEEYIPMAKAKNIKINLETKMNSLPILIDKQGIEIVIRNLMDNAVKYIKKKGEVKISLIKKNKLLRFEIEDNGVGIPKNDHKNIFQKFFRSRNIMKHETVGTGLGLFIAKSIIKKSKGKIGFRSKENKETTFWFEIPIKNKIK
ncbi:MAG: HAMP domain-containing sensor histidine kinase [Patescibacteria group bacterium]